ncbi:MAG: tRNA (cytidine(34)-2'-O)-methyltransferase [Betaproteobacteria bacterium]|jgi:tRNA (cytidine/uridine-2'-O-)-methyltransferase|nr:tRNA (cytidine(34)-2'-O)-methyltransferase [Betaproteobacteria bacterium]
MFEIVLYQPEIPPNAGNVIRLAANTGARLHLVGPIGFGLDERSLRRAGLDYADLASTELHADWASCVQRLAGRRVFALTTRATRYYTEEHYVPGDVFLFGPESRGLPADLLGALPADRRMRLPMLQGNRSLNLSNAVAVVVYEAWRQVGFAGADSGPD